MQSWVHKYQFAQENGKTRLTDEIAFSLPGGFLIELLGGWLVQAQLEHMFRYRHELTERECENIVARLN